MDSFLCMYLISKYPAVLNEGKECIFSKNHSYTALVNPVLMLALIPVTFLPGLCSVHLFHRQVGLLFILLLLLAEMIVKASGKRCSSECCQSKWLYSLHYAASKNRHEVGFHCQASSFEF